MIKNKELKDTELTLSIDVAASKEKAFEAWTKAELMSQWMGPPNVNCEQAEINFKVGGDFRLCLMSPVGIHTAVGKYLEVNPPDDLTFTWHWEEGEYRNSQVSVKFEAIGGKTRVTLHHTLLPSREAVESHAQGWTGSLEGLSEFLNK